eukprot:GSA120T00010746001.1
MLKGQHIEQMKTDEKTVSKITQRLDHLIALSMKGNNYAASTSYEVDDAAPASQHKNIHTDQKGTKKSASSCTPATLAALR